MCLKNKISKEEISRIEFMDKNVIKFPESRSALRSISNLNDKYELCWKVAENERSGIIYFDQPVSFDVN